MPVYKRPHGKKPWFYQFDLPGSTREHRNRMRQDAFRAQFGTDYRNDLDLVFAHEDGSPLRPGSISATVSALFKRLKIPKPKGTSLHLLRHTVASQMLDSGVPLPVVSQRLLGHSSPDTNVCAVQRWIVTRPAYDQWERSCGVTPAGLPTPPEVRVLT